ncbi:hypothetical protein B0H19DRAFT_1079370 [Mycena capillaripes]|nr:hypothetical protein B0H19DRAFT_1079370 [Mycena capillaripes]
MAILNGFETYWKIVSMRHTSPEIRHKLCAMVRKIPATDPTFDSMVAAELEPLLAIGLHVIHEYGKSIYALVSSVIRRSTNQLVPHSKLRSKPVTFYANMSLVMRHLSTDLASYRRPLLQSYFVRCANPSFIMFVSLARAGLAILCITNSVIARPQRYTQTRRAADCTAQCQAMQASIASSETKGIAVLCTPDVANQYKACLGCEVAISLVSQLDAQAVADSLVASCKTAGHTIDSIAVTSISPDAPAPATSSPAPAPTPPASVTSKAVAAPTQTTPGSVSPPQSPVSQTQSQSQSVPPSVPSLPPSSSVPVPSAPLTSQSSTPALSTISKPTSSGTPSGTDVADPAESTVVSSPPPNGAAHHAGGLVLVNAVFVLSVLALW